MHAPEATRRAVDRYLEDNDLQVDTMNALGDDMHHCKNMLPFVGDDIKEWKGFKAKFFFTDLFCAHKTLYNTVHNYLEDLRTEKKNEEDAQEKQRVESRYTVSH